MGTADGDNFKLGGFCPGASFQYFYGSIARCGDITTGLQLSYRRYVRGDAYEDRKYLDLRFGSRDFQFLRCADTELRRGKHLGAVYGGYHGNSIGVGCRVFRVYVC